MTRLVNHKVNQKVNQRVIDFCWENGARPPARTDLGGSCAGPTTRPPRRYEKGEGSGSRAGFRTGSTLAGGRASRAAVRLSKSELWIGMRGMQREQRCLCGGGFDEAGRDVGCGWSSARLRGRPVLGTVGCGGVR
jgi:hypothetical protein